MIRPATSADSDAIARIYNHYIANTVITFEEKPVSPEEMAQRINKILSAKLPWLVAERNGEATGYAYATQWRERSAYRFSVESTVYVDPRFAGQGLGTRLYETLLSSLRKTPAHIAIGGITLPNPASVALHEKLGFTKVAHFKEVGFKCNQWLDVGYWQARL